MYLSGVCTLSVNIAGISGISLAGFVDGLPMGMQIVAKPLAEEMLIRVAFAYGQITERHKLKPPVE